MGEERRAGRKRASVRRPIKSIHRPREIAVLTEERDKEKQEERRLLGREGEEQVGNERGSVDQSEVWRLGTTW
jgi:hypothetical protein